jgi:hypothetical protein
VRLGSSDGGYVRGVGPDPMIPWVQSTSTIHGHFAAGADLEHRRWAVQSGDLPARVPGPQGASSLS